MQKGEKLVVVGCGSVGAHVRGKYGLFFRAQS